MPPTGTTGLSAEPLGRPAWPHSLTERNWLTSALIVAASVVAATILYTLETNAGRWNDELRFIYAPSETVMRLFGMSHFLVATVYLVTSRSMRGARAWSWFGVLLLLGGVLCLGFHRLAGLSNPIASALFLLYFAAHDLRDQVFFYFENGEAPPEADRRTLGAALFWAPMWLLLAVGMAAMAIAVGGAPGAERLRHMGQALPMVWRWGLGALLVGWFGLASARLLQLRARVPWRSLAAALRENRPIVVVLAGTIVIALLGALPGWNAQFLVILHVTAWYVFTLRRLLAHSAASPSPPAGTWRWLRTTPAGFNLLHLGSLALLAIAGVVWAYGFRSDPSLVPLWLALDVDLFPAWTLLHVTVSFRPR